MRISLLLLAAATILAACSTRPTVAPAPPMFGTPIPNAIAPQPESTSGSDLPTPAADASLQVIVVPSEIVVGPNRFAVGVIDAKQGMVHEAQVHFTYFDLSNSSKPVVESQADAVSEQTPDGATTIYAHERDFNRAGNWGVQVDVRYPDGHTASQRVGFQVLASSPTLKVGQPAPAFDTPTAATAGNDLKKLTSAEHPNPAFYQLTLAQALKNGKPTVLVLSTPAFCTSRLCGPAYDTESELAQRYGDKLNYISVEVYTGLPNPAATNWQLSPAMQALGLQTEPWLFLMSKDGTVAYRVEGLFTTDEVAHHIDSVLSGG